MKRFINHLLKRLAYKNFDLVTEKHLEMIGDVSIPKSSYSRIVFASSSSDDNRPTDILSRRRALYE